MSSHPGWTALLLLVACTPAPAAMELSGCAALAVGPRCTLAAGEPVRVVVAAGPGARVEVAADGRLLPEAGTAVEGGWRVTVTPPETARLLTVTVRDGGGRRRSTVALSPPVRDDRLDRAAALRLAGDDQGARQILVDLLAAARGERATVTTSRLARVELSLGRPEQALALLARAAEEHHAAGRLSQAADDATVAAYVELDLLGRYPRARAALTRAAGWTGQYPDGRIRLAYYLSVLASRTGDVKGALAAALEGVELATRFGNAALEGMVRPRAAVVLEQLGRFAEARAHLVATRGAGRERQNPCGLADMLTAEAWVLLLAREAGAGGDGAPRPLLERAARELETRCRQPSRQANVLVNLALAAVQEGRLPDAEAALARARAIQPSPPAPLGQWSIELAGRVAMARRQPAVALDLYRRMESLAAAAGLDEGRWRAHLGEARALAALGDEEEAATAYAGAERLLEGEALSVPLTGGLEGFLAEREATARERVAVLVRLGRPAEALAAVRQARARFVRALARQDQLRDLAPGDRARWDGALAAYQRERQSIESEAAQDWTLSQEALALVQRQRQRRLDQVVGLLEAAVSALPHAGAGRAPVGAAPRDTTLAYFPRTGGWYGFAADDHQVMARALGPVAPGDSAARVAATLLAPFDELLARARALRVLAFGGLHAVDFHALPFRGRPLVAQAPVVYGIDAGGGGSQARCPDGGALVVANPRRYLPAAIREGALVRDRLAGCAPLMLGGPEATRAAVLSALAGRALFHYAGHSVFGGDGWQSALLLAGADELTVGDVLTVDAPPRRVVLSSCDAARQRPGVAVEGISLAHAFVLAGTESVVAAVRPVPDDVALALMDRFYAAGGAVDPAPALRQAQLEALEREPGLKEWPAFRVFTP
jgi:tetratricopeptide (TPR) repeat protein